MSQEALPLLQPQKEALAAYLVRFHAQFVGDTRPALDWAKRKPAQAIAVVPSRMVDSAEQMVAAWRANQNAAPGSRSTGAYLPIMLVGLSNRYNPVMGDYGRQIHSRVPFSFPDDEQGRVFEVRLVQGTVDAQVVIAAPDPESAWSIAAQLALYMSGSRNYSAIYQFAGLKDDWPVALQIPEPSIGSVPVDGEPTLTVLAVDFTLVFSAPIFYSTDGSAGADASGMDLVREVHAVSAQKEFTVGTAT